MAYTEREARKLVVEAGRRLLERGLVARTWGNISARVSDTHFIITPSGMAYDTMTEDQLVLVDGRDGSYQGERKPSSERGIHADAYRLRPEVNFVIHTHQDMASVCSTAGRDLTADHPLLGGRVPCAAYGLPSSKALRRAAERVVAGYPDSPAFLLRSHGALCLGRDMEDAFAVSAALEEVCARQIQSVLDTPSLPARIPDYGESVLEGDAFRLMIGERERIFSLDEARLPPPRRPPRRHLPRRPGESGPPRSGPGCDRGERVPPHPAAHGGRPGPDRRGGYPLGAAGARSGGPGPAGAKRRTAAGGRGAVRGPRPGGGRGGVPPPEKRLSGPALRRCRPRLPPSEPDGRPVPAGVLRDPIRQAERVRGRPC